MFFWTKKNETPLTQAIITGNTELVMRLAQNSTHRTATNYLGFSALDLAYYLGNEELMALFGYQGDRTFKVVKKGEGLLVEMGIEEYESFFETKYVPSVRFCSSQELYKIVKKCPLSLKKGRIGTDMRALYEENREKIKTGYVVDATIKWLDDKTGYGLFANVSIKKGEMVGEYTGLVLLRNLFAREFGDYCMRYPRLSFGLSYFTLDAGRMGNEMRFANHNYTPNMQPTVALENGLSHSILVASRDIEPGEQLTYDYGEDYWSWRDPPQDF